ncbi:MAG TPA: hypothetical protein VFE33_24710 [Thermoanaerobaculia bacterium]|nr:hypothetical protein [Thermoanaerobaculia bacterium]
MSFTLRIFMVDLIAFVRDTKDHFWALLPDARKLGNAQIPDHYPILVFDDGSSSSDAGDWPRIKQLIGLTAIKPDTAWLLDQEDITITFQGQSLPPTSTGTISQPLPDLSNRQSFDWVPKMADISSANKDVNPDLVDKAKPFPAQLSARLELPDAQPATFAFSKLLLGLTPLLFPATFPGSGSSFRRVLADVVIAKYTVTGPQIQIQASKHGAVNFKPQSDPCDILLTNISPAPAKQNTDPYGRHFSLYFPLSSGPANSFIPLLDVNAASLVAGKVEKEPEPKALNEMDDNDEVGALSRPVCTFVQFDHL